MAEATVLQYLAGRPGALVVSEVRGEPGRLGPEADHGGGDPQDAVVGGPGGGRWWHGGGAHAAGQRCRLALERHPSRLLSLQIRGCGHLYLRQFHRLGKNWLWKTMQVNINRGPSSAICVTIH